MSNVFGKLQKLGKALMLPVAVMPVAALMLRLGAEDVFNIPFIASAGSAVFDNLAILFAIGVAVGLAKDNNGSAALAGAVGYFVLTKGTAAINDTINMGVLAGMLAGIAAGLLYNKYHDIKLPDFLGFFGGRRFVPIVTSLVMIIAALIFGYVWPPVQGIIDAIGHGMVAAGAAGTFAFGFLNRLLIPVGLHHVINSFTWFVFGEFNGATGDLNRFFAQIPAQGLMDPSAGMFMTGFFPVMMFGLPAAALAMIKTAKKENRKAVTGALLGVAFTSFLTGITEPIEFMFMFLAPALYVAHALLTGVSMAVTYVMGIRHGFGFSAGAIDYFLNMGLATKGWLLIPVGIVFGIIYYFLFVFIIEKMDLPTPGRVDEEGGKADDLIADKGLSGLAREYIKKLGGKSNIVEVDSCITRLRLTVNDASIIKDEELKALGATGVLRPNKKNLQVVVGTKAELIANEIKRLL
ncbi:MAG: N-acetylglucosamine system or component [Epulopiscium sp.]|jgi:PTS system N-acetylglucosamine-specific IIC component|uniref:PTS sugar transporter n=1 Tax=Defluviitalea raffinosedens TaxID=1450156 RepID=A0A7C8LDF7_9FIRM|nr:N-acetylglucosamine-specific PTS transporter subunit IIBC [Defluviitalea raffinosedens]MBZ4667326.1 acetylglucosamine transporter subunit [Defluviitaleaceae bacterium]MDK2787622.1 N-acetylglucosamine system or component [Candidatus Epulonipiscium sp.]KAE9635665.1 PTS sugar transporter [Defluviitalea raffinosedens]MBM7684591.1 PTS system N-acetylglucosamine-specific IIC component [Defluviitalea raffinosedens]HHW68308.1 PTS transporter subunit EIIC [Candidatus Epulonipiscium sp.]